jgi:4-hydroxy-tetrahydrodipicolinate synthase
MTNVGLTGINAALPLPMHADQSADFDSFRRYCEWVAAQGVDAVTVNADTAEGAHLTLDERIRMVQVAREVLGPDVGVVSGLMGTSTASAVQLAQTLSDAGADALLVFPIPAFSGLPLPVELVHGYYSAVAGVGVPLIAFSLTPDLGGALLGRDTVLALANDRLIVGIKDASFNPLSYLETRDAVRAATHPVALLSGCDNFIYESFVLGADGVLLGYCSIAAALTRQVFEAVKAGRLREAEELNITKMQPLAAAMFGAPLRNSRARIKAALVELDLIDTEVVRSPLIALASADRDAMIQVTKQAGIL